MAEALAEKFHDLKLDEVRTEGNIRPTSANDKNGSEESSDVLIRNDACFPRSEYKTRFQGTSAFDFSDPLFWTTYVRSTPRGGKCDRIARTQRNTVYDNLKINKSLCSDKNVTSPSKTGCKISPWAFTKYNQIFDSETKCKNIYKNNISSSLYDDLLNYKIYICRAVENEFLRRKRDQSKINVYFLNEFPCIMVQIPDFSKHSKNKKEQSSLYKIAIAYFTAIANRVAFKRNIPIELVIRSSFGHNIPSVSETKTSFRINVGVVPECYAKVLARSLYSFDIKFLEPLLNRALKLHFEQNEINLHNQNVKKYSIRVENWKANENAWDLLCKPGDSSGRKVSYQITRQNYYADLIADYAHEVLLSSDEIEDFAKPLEKVLKKLTYGKKVSLNCGKDDFNNRKFEFSNIENKSIKNDNKFWDIIQKISSVFTMVVNITDLINNKKIKGLYSLLEKANLEFVKNSAIQNSQDGHGSSSDCEVSFENTSFYSKKIIVNTGMRAINLALFLSMYLAGKKNIDTDYMYYETSDAEKFVKNISESRKTETETVICIDLNHCSSNGPNSAVNIQQIYKRRNREEKVIMILDYTSAQSKKIRKAIKLFTTHKNVSALILVNSGIKNEQIGADMNPYGTLRFIARTSDDLNKLYYTARICLQTAEERLPKQSHNIRKAYKDIGAVITNAAIYTRDEGFDYKPNAYHTDDILEYINTQSYESAYTLEKISLLFSPLLSNLKANFSPQDVISWDLKKILFFNSDDVLVVKNYYYEWDTSIDHMKYMYDFDSEFTNTFVKKLAYQIRNRRLHLIDQIDIESLAQDYRKHLNIPSLFFSVTLGIRKKMIDWNLEKISFF